MMPIATFIDLLAGPAVRLDGDGLLVGPRDRLTDDDRDAIRRWKPHLRPIVAYVERGAVQ